jgi:hypothetical protein
VIRYVRRSSADRRGLPSRSGPQRHSVRLAGAGIIVVAFGTWIIGTYNSAIAVSLSATRHSISDAPARTGEDAIVLRVALRRQRPVRVQVEGCAVEIRLLGGAQGSLDIAGQVGWALTQALRAPDDTNSLAAGAEVSYQVSFRAPDDRALDVKVVASGAPPILQWIGCPAWSASIIVPPAGFTGGNEVTRHAHTPPVRSPGPG